MELTMIYLLLCCSEECPAQSSLPFMNIIGFPGRNISRLTNLYSLSFQDWGSLIGLRMVAEAPNRFDRIVLANGGLPTGATRIPFAFTIWQVFARYSPWFPIGRIAKAGCVQDLRPAEVAAYDAPFPSDEYLIATVENPWDKYAVSSRQQEEQRTETLKTLDGFLKSLGYLRVDHGPHPRTNRT